MTPHGKASTYRHSGCRCPECREAHRISQREVRARHRPPAIRQTIRQIENERRKVAQEAERAAIRDRFADYQPPDVRTYGRSPSGIDYDAAIRAAAVASVPYPESPNRGTKRP